MKNRLRYINSCLYIFDLNTKQHSVLCVKWRKPLWILLEAASYWFNSRVAGDLDSINNIAYFFSVFLTDNVSICRLTIPIFGTEWERSIVCVKWIIAQEAGAAKRLDKRAGTQGTSDGDQWKWKSSKASLIGHGTISYSSNSESRIHLFTCENLFKIRPVLPSKNTDMVEKKCLKEVELFALDIVELEKKK